MSTEGAARFGEIAGKRRPASQPAPAQPPRKYTLLLDLDAAEAFDSDVARLRRAAGRHVAKSDVIRALLTALHDDPSLLSDIASRLQARP